MEKSGKRLAKIIALLVACVLLLPGLPTQSCEPVDRSEEACCSCCGCHDSEPLLSDEGIEREECSCEMSEGQKEEGSPAVVTFQPEKRPEITPLETDTDRTAAAIQIEFSNLTHHPLILPNKDQPLYILYSSFLI
jgi:hypothetical protein